MARMRVSLCLLCLALLAAGLWVRRAVGDDRAQATVSSASDSDPAVTEFFEKEVRPLLVARCHECHSAKKQKQNLRLDSRASILAGGDTGPAIVPGKAEESLLIDAINYGDLYQMPPKGKLPDAEIATLTKWVEMGAPWPGQGGSKTRAANQGLDLRERARHWCFQPLRDPDPPALEHVEWSRTPIDRFVLAQLEAHGLSPARDADKRTLIRRVTFDLIGLPPTPQEIDAFLADESSDAYAKLVERLLASPHYGERWGRHWLDLVRFAETAGHEFDYDVLAAYRYRDYVVRALNADVPYDQFVVEHVAGDLLDPPRRHPVEGFNESILATGCFFFGDGTHSPVDLREEASRRIENQIDVLSKTFLGLTVACARCHDHKFDPVSTRDYYALAGYLKSSRIQQAFIDTPEGIAAKVSELDRIKSQLAAALACAKGSPEMQIAAYLLAARQVIHAPQTLVALDEPGRTGGPARENNLEILVQRAARVHGLDEAALGRWVKAIGEEQASKPGHPLHPWVTLAGFSGNADPEQFESHRRKLAEQLKALRATDNETSILFEDFPKSTFDGWFVTGDAFGAGPSGPGALRVRCDQAGTTLLPIAPGRAHSGLVSDRLQGVLRSQTFAIEHKSIHYLAAGRGGRINLVVDGFEKIRAPIYGGLTIAIDHGDAPRWYTQDVAMWLGHNAYIEIADGAAGNYTGGKTEYQRGDGFIAVDEIRFSDQPSAPIRHGEFASELLDDPEIRSLETLARRYERQIGEIASQCWSGRRGTSDRATERAALLAWLSDHKLIPRDALEPPHDGSFAALVARYRDALAQMPEPRLALAIADGTGRDERINVRGNPKTLGELAPRRFLEVLAGSDQPAPQRGSGRLELARRMVDRSNPLLPRVMVNRIWQHHFGAGLVATPDDFGAMGQPPSHPELLDYLASAFIRHGWSIKKLHRLVVLSRTYQMQSAADPAAEQADPTNRLLHRMNVRRLEAEAIRDAILAVSGRLDRTLYGPSVPPHLTPFMEGRGKPTSSGPLDGNGRRSLYINVRRNFLTPMFLAFDFPLPATTMGRRNVSNVPAQALTLLNDPFVVAQARLWATHLLAEKEKSADQTLCALYSAALGRPPTSQERKEALAFLDAQAKLYGSDAEGQAWTDLCHVLINVKEFIFVN